MSAQTNQTYIAAFTPNYLFRGVVGTGSARLSDMLNDHMTDYLEVLNVRVYKVANPNTLAFQTNDLFLKKQHIDVIVILKEGGGPATRRLYSFVAKERTLVMLFLRSFELRGYIHLQGKHEILGPLTRDGEVFIPVTDATLVHTSHPRIKVTAPTVLLREAALDGFYIES